jgi:probable HAF family extracellular repeat protein
MCFTWSNRCTLLAVLLTGSAASPAVAASLTALGDLPGGDFMSHALGVSGDGSTVVGYSDSASGHEAFRWTKVGGIVGLGDLPGGYFDSIAFGVSGDGSVIVGESHSASTEYNEAFRWTAVSGMVGLGELPGGHFDSTAWGVSGDGAVVVGQDSTATAFLEAFRWTQSGGMVGLGQLPDIGFWSTALAVSADGSTIVGRFGALGQEAYRWTSSSGMVGLGDGSATGVSGDGSVVVGYRGFSSDSGVIYKAFRWTDASGMVGLGDLPGGDFSNYAKGVSGDGSTVVGYAATPSNEAFLWTSAGGMQRLWDVLVANGVEPAASGWTSLDFAQAISADGKTIVGQGIHNGNQEAFVAVIPEPSSLALLGFGGTLLFRPRRHRRQPASPVRLAPDWVCSHKVKVILIALSLRPAMTFEEIRKCA